MWVLQILFLGVGTQVLGNVSFIMPRLCPDYSPSMPACVCVCVCGMGWGAPLKMVRRPVWGHMPVVALPLCQIYTLFLQKTRYGGTHPQLHAHICAPRAYCLCVCVCVCVCVCSLPTSHVWGRCGGGRGLRRGPRRAPGRPGIGVLGGRGQGVVSFNY